MKSFEPMTVVPGGTRKYERHPVTGELDPLKPLSDHKGRPVWNMPEPSRSVIHFKNEGCRRHFLHVKAKVEANVADGTIPAGVGNKILSDNLQANTHQVPVYRGVSASLARQLRGEARRRRREEEWKHMLENMATVENESVEQKTDSNDN